MIPKPDEALTAHALVRTYLRDRDLRLWPWIDVGHLERLVASIGTGADPLEGEEPVAILLHTGTTRGGCLGGLELLANVLNPIKWAVRSAMKRIDWNYGALITDHRIVIRDWLDAVDAPYESIEDPTCSGGLTTFMGADFLNFTIGEERHSLTVPGHTALQRFLAIASVEAREGRIEHVRIGAPAAEDADPSGAISFLASTVVEDARAGTLLQVIATETQTGRLSGAEGLDLARRTALLHRATVSARGSRDGLWVSCLRREELTAFLESRLGRPEPDEHEDGLETVRFTRDREYGRAAAATALLLASGRLDAALPKGDLRVSIDERSHPTGGEWTGYRIEVRVPGMWQPISEFESEALFELHKALLAYEAQILLRRVVLGADKSVLELLGVPQEQVDARLVEHAPDVDPKLFKQTRDFANLYKRVVDLPARNAATQAELPSRLKAPPSLRIPGAVTAVVMSNILAGLTTLVLFSTVYCFGGVAFMTWLEEAVLSRIPGLNEEATAAMLILAVSFQWMAMLFLGPLRVFGGMIVLALPRTVRPMGVLLGLLGLGGLLFADIPGFLVAVPTLFWISRPQVKEFVG